MTCTIDGCDAPRYGRGLCRSHWKKARRWGDPTFVRFSDEHRRQEFWRKVNIAGPDECWEWTGPKRAHGYGQFSFARTNTVASRVAWELANGSPFPADKFACHRCDNPPCCNPAHIFVGTQTENMRDMAAKGRAVGAKPWTHCSKGHPMSGVNLKVDSRGRRACAICRKELDRRSNARKSARRSAERAAARALKEAMNRTEAA